MSDLLFDVRKWLSECLGEIAWWIAPPEMRRVWGRIYKTGLEVEVKRSRTLKQVKAEHGLDSKH